MRKKIILGLVTFVLAAGAYFALSSGDRRGGRPPDRDASDVVREFVSLPTTRPGYAIGGTDMPLRPGDRTLARVYDDVTGRLKYQFEAEKWEPVSDTDYHVVGLLIQIHAPRGEITYISADTADVAIAQKASKRLEPKRGWLRGNVRIVIDRTTSTWREANPELADRYAHPEDLIHIELDDARFDMDQAELRSSGPIVVDSSEARIENVSGLTLQWNQLDNRIDMLRFTHGGRMLLRRGGRLVDFAMPGTERAGRGAASGEAPGSVGDGRRVGGANYKVPPAQANKPMSIEAVTADEAAAEIRLEAGIAVANRPKSLETGSRGEPLSGGGSEGLRSRDALAEAVEEMRAEAREGATGEPMQLDVSGFAEAKGRKRIHTYRAVFTHAVVVEQMVGLQTTGKLEADRLEINFDFGQKLRSLAGSRHAHEGSASAGGATANVEGGGGDTSGAASDMPLEEDRTRLVLTWDGPLEMRPLRVEPSEQTGQRFDAIAQGHPVKVESERGRARCEQLVYRHERRQVWLSGGAARSVELSIQDGRYLLVGREVFFDQRRGLARVDGAGYMLDEQGTAPGAETALASGADRETRDPVEIRWSRGVDIELGHRMVKRKDPSTGLLEDKRLEFLQRAWFHGDVLVKRGESRLFAKDEVAATFGVLSSSAEMADYIKHLDMSGAVRLVRGDDLIRADRLAVDMMLTPEGENVAKAVDATGRVLVRQGESSFRADWMHAVFAPPRRQSGEAGGGVAPAFGGSQVAIKTLEASGHVAVDDPSRSFRVRRAQTLSCVMRDGQELVRATIVSPAPSVFARVRYGEVAIHGHRIEIDMDVESLDVPGPGKAWMITQNDFGGNKLKRPTSVLVTWKDWTQFRLARDYAEFVGDVHSETRPLRDEAWRGAQMLLWDAAAGCAVLGSHCVSATAGRLTLGLVIQYHDYGRLSHDMEKEWRTFALDCDRLKIRFARVPVAPAPAKEAEDLGRLASMREALVGKPRRALVEAGASDRRPAHVDAEGHASAMSVTRVPGASGRLVSRVLIQGDRIVVDLMREQMSVPCAGDLLIEDYQFDPAVRRRLASGAALGRGPLMSAMGSEGASQTAITWANSMDFFVDRSLIAFDQNVEMLHRSGQKMVMQEELAEAMQIDPDGLRHLGAGRQATLTCGYLLLEFLSGGGSDSRSVGTSPTVRATDLKRLIAKHAVNLQDGTKSLMGAHLQYLHASNEVRLEGSAALEARIIDQDEARQRFNMWRGPLLIWNRETNRIEAPEARIRTSRR